MQYVSVTTTCCSVHAAGLWMGPDQQYNLSDRQADRQKDRQLPPITLRHLTKAFACTIWTPQSN